MSLTKTSGRHGIKGDSASREGCTVKEAQVEGAREGESQWESKCMCEWGEVESQSQL